MGKEGPCRHCGVTSELLFFSKAIFLYFLLLILCLFYICYPFVPPRVVSNYASGKRVLEEIFRVPWTQMPNLACSLWIEVGSLFGEY